MSSYRWGVVTQTGPLRVQLDGDSAPTSVTPIDLVKGHHVVGDRVRCQVHAKALLVTASESAPARDLYLRNLQTLVSGGGVRMVTSTGVKWTQRFIGIGGGRGSLAPSGYFDITQPADGTVIPVHGMSGTTSVTVASGYVPLAGWQALWYDLPLGASSTSQDDRFHVTGYSVDFDVPPTWVLLCVRNADTGSYMWADGQETAPWTYPTPSSPWSNYGSGYASLAYKRQNGIVYLEGLLRGATSSSTGTIFVLPAGYRPAGGSLIVVGHASGGLTDIRVYTSGTVTVAGFLAGGNANDVSLSNISFPADQ